MAAGADGGEGLKIESAGGQLIEPGAGTTRLGVFPGIFFFQLISMIFLGNHLVKRCFSR